MGLLLAIGLVALSSSGITQTKDRRTALDQLMLAYASDGWSGAVLVSEGGVPLLAKGYGFADFQADRANDADTLFEIASITKSFTATAVVKLAQEKRLLLDDSIAVYLPGVPASSSQITVRQLLSHTSGISAHNVAGRGDDLAQALIAYLGGGPEAKPGSRFEYWNGGYALLAGVIERASGRAYTQYLEEELFAPAGMKSTGFTGDAELDAQRAALGFASKGLARTALEHPYGSYGYQYRGMGGIVTSVHDLFAFDRALAGAALLDAKHEAELFTPVANGYALGWYVGRTFDGSPRQSHGGLVRGFVSELRRLPEHDAFVAVLCNRDDAKPWEVADDLECVLLGRALPHPPPAVTLLASDEAHACAGDYVAAAGRLTVRAAEGALMAGVEGQALIDALGGHGKLDWKADFAALSQRAVEILEGLAHDDTAPLRASMAKRIPKDWPDWMRRTIWPAYLERHGEFLGARPVGAWASQGHVEVLLATEHANGPSRVLMVFGPAGLERLDLDEQVPQFPVSARLAPVRKGVFRFVLGEDPAKLEFELGGEPAKSVRVAGLKLVRN
jgi:CubicO group peptidase (beta-lactamase class C family)